MAESPSRELPVKICLSSAHISVAMCVEMCAWRDRVWNENKNLFIRENSKVARLTEDIPLADQFQKIFCLFFAFYVEIHVNF